jgi:hypothetical protein
VFDKEALDVVSRTLGAFPIPYRLDELEYLIGPQDLTDSYLRQAAQEKRRPDQLSRMHRPGFDDRF